MTAGQVVPAARSRADSQARSRRWLGGHPERTRDIRRIYLHMIEKYARHNGHAGLIRERMDGVTRV